MGLGHRRHAIYVAKSASTGLQRGGWSALDVNTGAILWTTSDPGLPSPFFPPEFGIYGYSAQGPVSTANGLVYACSLSFGGPMVAMDSATGDIRWKRDSGASCIGGAAISQGTVFWGTGYRAFAPLSTPGERLFAFTPGGS